MIERTDRCPTDLHVGTLRSLGMSFDPECLASWVPARPGDHVNDIDTPCLLIDRDALERNLRGMGAFARTTGIRLRPHAKSHKCGALARLQVAHGAIGLCAQKLGEAEPLVALGVDVLITNQVVGARKVARLAALAAAYPASRLGVLVDAVENVRALGDAMRDVGAALDVYVEVDVGQRRAGVMDPSEAVLLATAIGEQPSLRFRGIHAYHGGAQHRRSPDERRTIVSQVAILARATKEALAEAGIVCEIVTGAGTGTFPFEAASGAFDEIQPGSYVLMDVDYAKNVVDEDTSTPKFESSLFILSTITSLRADRMTLDAGTKAQSTDCGFAQPTFSGWRVRGVYDEHTVLDRVAAGSATDAKDETHFALGDKVRLIPGHVDPTVNLHDWFVVVSGDRVTDVWPIEGRGRFY